MWMYFCQSIWKYWQKHTHKIQTDISTTGVFLPVVLMPVYPKKTIKTICRSNVQCQIKSFIGKKSKDKLSNKILEFFQAHYSEKCFICWSSLIV